VSDDIHVEARNVTGYVAVDNRVWVATKAEIERLTRERDEAREAIRRWLHIADFSGMHRSCSCACCAELKKVVGEI
jgi:hypothetical protein